ncbi:uncharacterized protein LOC134814704 [Bolinopsis microptera]|uniref:uncharacterized protein LOC134814704 n=1 Tax=Bolinopsis microptera TaxID=2820187 RepID=UPI00307A5CB4
MLHSLHLTLEDCVALVNTAIKEHSLDTGYTGPLPLHHSFTLTLRLLLHTLQSSRVIRHPKTKDIALRKLVFGRSHKYDGYVRDIVKVCLMFLRMEQVEEFSGLFPPTPLSSLGQYEESTSSEEEEEEELSDSVISDLDDEEEIMDLNGL